MDTPRILGGPPAKIYPDVKTDDATLAPTGLDTFTMHLMRVYGESRESDSKLLQRIREIRLLWLLM